MLAGNDQLLSSEERKYHVISQAHLIHHAQADSRIILLDKTSSATMASVFFFELYFSAKIFSLEVSRPPANKGNLIYAHIPFRQLENSNSLAETIIHHLNSSKSTAIILNLWFYIKNGDSIAHTTAIYRHKELQSEEKTTYVFFDSNLGEYHLNEKELPLFFMWFYFQYNYENLIFQIYPVSLKNTAKPKIPGTSNTK
ncbi:hypothetical protein [Pelagibaculum spongiae]|uniref:Peptidase C58 YopT-type domain-containing protein n=1 Tax=Pelagibaculum spongiae TaxID=2080658 RepID=A0A2V1GYE7_9GAMM|nr:hypothetical protein [Pelagibaculum spongiae]PVZ70357.1 hypothetical protein DC094_07115 [Pelagibaculum spongiae]